MITNDVIIAKMAEYDSYMREMRQHFHTYPELSSEEFETTERLQKEVKSLGLDVVMVSKTGFYAILDTGRPGKTIGVRTDIDALPIVERETNLKGARTCISTRENIMHACGHDGHMASQLALVHALVDLKDQLVGRVVFIFEEGEEIGTGIRPMVAALKPLGIDAIYGTHLASFMETGMICADPGPRMAGSALINFDVVGKSGHGSRPDLSINPVFAAGQILSAMSMAWTNRLDVSKPVTLGITQLHGGDANNVIPESVFIGGSLRFFDVAAGQIAFDTLKDVVEKTAAVHQCHIVYHDNNRMGAIPVINDDALATQFVASLHDLFPNRVVDDVKWYASESFARYSGVAPSVFAFVGIKNDALGSGAEHHNDYFDLDEDALQYAFGATLKFVTQNL